MYPLAKKPTSGLEPETYGLIFHCSPN